MPWRQFSGCAPLLEAQHSRRWVVNPSCPLRFTCFLNLDSVSFCFSSNDGKFNSSFTLFFFLSFFSLNPLSWPTLGWAASLYYSLSSIVAVPLQFPGL